MTPQEINEYYAQLAAGAGSGNHMNQTMNALLRQQLAQQGANWQAMPGTDQWGNKNTFGPATTAGEFNQFTYGDAGRPMDGGSYLSTYRPGGGLSNYDPNYDPVTREYNRGGTPTIENYSNYSATQQRGIQRLLDQGLDPARFGYPLIPSSKGGSDKQPGGGDRPPTGGGTTPTQPTGPTGPGGGGGGGPTAPGGTFPSTGGEHWWNPDDINPNQGTNDKNQGPGIDGPGQEGQWPYDKGVANSQYPFNAFMADNLGVYGPTEMMWLSAMQDWHEAAGIPAGGLPPTLQYYGNKGDEFANLTDTPAGQNTQNLLNNLSGWALGNAQGNTMPGWIMQQGQNKAESINQANRMLGSIEGGENLREVAAGELGDPMMLNGINMDTVAQIANNPYLSGQIDAVNRDIARSLTEAGLPQNAMQAAGTGNSGSTRRGVMDAILTRGTQDRMGDVASQMRSQAYNQGVGVSADQAARNQQASLSNQQMQFQADLSAALANQRAGLEFSGQQLGAAQLAAGIGNQGIADVLSGNNMLMGNMQAGLQAGLLDQAIRQQAINADMNRFNFNQLSPYHTMAAYKNLIGLPGSTPWTSTQQGAGAGITPSSQNQLGQLGMALGGNMMGGGSLFG